LFLACRFKEVHFPRIGTNKKKKPRVKSNKKKLKNSPFGTLIFRKLIMNTARVERMLRYRMFRTWALFDRKNFKCKRIVVSASSLRGQQMQLLAFLSGNRDITPPVGLENIDQTMRLDDVRKYILYPRLKEISKLLRGCKRHKRRNKRRLKNYEPRARALRSVFGDIASHILEFV